MVGLPNIFGVYLAGAIFSALGAVAFFGQPASYAAEEIPSYKFGPPDLDETIPLGCYVFDGQLVCPSAGPSTSGQDSTTDSSPDTSAPVRASRTFLGPHDYPPKQYAAYGILAFPALATPTTQPRHVMICRAYRATLPQVNDSLPPEEQMVTVWPVATTDTAKRLNTGRGDELCKKAVSHYHLRTALTALHHARITGANLSEKGPYLLAWSPASAKGQPDALVLRADLSNVTTTEQAMNLMRRWREDIEQNPGLWRNGWSLERVRTEIRQWADKYGPQVLKLFGI